MLGCYENYRILVVCMDKIYVLLNKHKSVQSTHLVSLYVLFSNKYKHRNASPGNSSFKLSLFCTCIWAHKLGNDQKKIPLRALKLSTAIKIAKTLQTSQKAKLLLSEGRTPFANLTLLCSLNKGLCNLSKANQFCGKEYIPANQLTEVKFLAKKKIK